MGIRIIMYFEFKLTYKILWYEAFIWNKIEWRINLGLLDLDVDVEEFYHIFLLPSLKDTQFDLLLHYGTTNIFIHILDAF